MAPNTRMCEALPMPTVLLFPGQSSRYPGMLRKVCAVYPDVAVPIVCRASDVLGRDLAAEDDEPGPGTAVPNDQVQTSMFLANHIHWEILRLHGVDGDLSVGLSLGEYNHLVHIGALGFEDALRLVAARGAAYERGPTGAMAAVFPASEDEVRAAISRSPGTVEIANFNSPTQHVIAGHRPAIDETARVLEDEHAASCVVIESRLPMHSSLFSPVAELFRPALAAAAIRSPERPYVPNVLGRFSDDVTPARIRMLLADQVRSPVRFRHSIEMLSERFPASAYIEVGPRTVIFDLLHKRWRPFRKYRTDAEAEVFAAALADTVRDIQRVA